MALTLLIENYQVLDDGGPASVNVPQTGLQVGRRPGMGWVLPDASRHISGHHFDVSYQAGEWWLRDLSTNGTFLQGMRHRLDGPHRVEHGDRFQVGQYVIVALMDAPEPQGGMNPTSLPSYGGPVFAHEPEDDPWAIDAAGAAALPPIDPLPVQEQVHQPDFAQDFVAFPRLDEPAAPSPVPPLAPASVPVIAPASPPTDNQDGEEFLRAFCQGAGLSPELTAGVSARDLGLALGQAMRAATTEVMLALRDRASAKQFVRVGERTMRGAEDNNPLKFLPDPEQALEAMFLRPRAGFQTGAAGFDDALRDIRQHQAALFAALQPALMKLVGDLAPEAIEAASDGARFGAVRKSRAWEVFVQRWDAKTAPHENGILDEFISHFAAAYRDVVEAAGSGRG